MKIVYDNHEFKTMLMEQQNTIAQLLQQTAIPNTSYTQVINNNSNNKTFNLNLFLNEFCKNAMNFGEFIDSIQMQLTDLERFGEVGYVEGISSIITNQLKALDITKRPLHCTDRKRETIYIKENNQWEKEDDNKTHLKRAIQKIENKNLKLLPQYREKHPEYGNATHPISDRYNKMVVEAMGGIGKTDDAEHRIIKNIAKNVVVDKERPIMN